MTDAREQVIAGLEAAIRDPHCPLQYSPLLMQAQKLLRAIATPEPTEGMVGRVNALVPILDDMFAPGSAHPKGCLSLEGGPCQCGALDRYYRYVREVKKFVADWPALRSMPLQEDGWQRISTAPKNSKDLLLCVAGFSPLTGHWNESTGCWVSHPDHTSYEPTHWMPIRAVPAMVAEERTK